MLGFLCHSAALLFLPAYWIANIKCTNKTMLFLLVLFFPLVLIDTSAVIAKLISYGGLNEDVVYAYFNSSSDSFERAGLSLGLGVRILYFVFLHQYIIVKIEYSTSCLIYMDFIYCFIFH